MRHRTNIHYDFLNAYSDFPLVNSIIGGLRLWLENTKKNQPPQKKTKKTPCRYISQKCNLILIIMYNHIFLCI